FMLDEHGRRVGNKFKHTPHPQLRSVMEDFEATHQDMFDAVARSKFRHPDDYSIASALYHFHAYAQGKAIDSPIRYAYMDISRPDAELYTRRLLRRTDLDVLCLNDTDSSPESQERLDEIVSWFLNEKFPLPSSFEK
ncbi:sugar phosphotransferase, partial [Burkholderia multivorans]